MRTEKQIEASRLNGAKSRGPITDQGRINSRGHNRRHGILATTTVLEEESIGAFNAFADAYLADIQPRDAIERSLVETMINARWRLNRVRSIAKTAFDRDMALQDPTVGPAPVRAVFALAGTPSANDGACRPDLALRYETALERTYHTALRRLMALRKAKCFGASTRPFEPSEVADVWATPEAEPSTPPSPIEQGEETESENLPYDLIPTTH